ncbi:MAG: hypothetical protein LBD04_10025 [Synergistaceae bacterium]|jgi:hypothetical protein|nr:hypothetical protein [Synergistaceae bacterium]
MNVTSVLSRGYLQPSVRTLGHAGEQQSDPSSLSLQEQQVLAQEQALKATSAGAKVSTTYRYSIGPDGRRYITGAEVSIQGDEQTVNRVAGGVTREVGVEPVKDAEKKEPVQKGEKQALTREPGKNPGMDEAVRELKQIEQEVIAHESAHKAAGGRFAGAISYTYTQGPDGKSYITGGEVPIHVPDSGDPEQTLRDMEQVQRAATAPGDPSGPDMGVAARAAAAAAQARRDIAAARGRGGDSKEGEIKSGAASAQAGLRFEQIQEDAEGTSGKDNKGTLDLNETKDAYARSASKYGFWALGRGFELRMATGGPLPQIDLAA